MTATLRALPVWVRRTFHVSNEQDQLRRYAAGPRKSVVRTSDSPGIGRRTFLHGAATQGLVAAAAAIAPIAAAVQHAEAQVAAPGVARAPVVLREFRDPYIELIRLLREASEVEHALMLQYLYGAFSLKPTYAALRGTGAPNSNDLLGIAVQEMQHLGAVNRLLVALGAAPNLMPQDFPYEPDIYPFAFNLEPLSRHSLAKYIYAEAPAGAMSDLRPPELRVEIETALGRGVRTNQVGSLYDAVLAAMGQLEAENRRQRLPREVDFGYWRTQLTRIRSEGELEHYRFFRSVFSGTHTAFGLRLNAWALPVTHPNYPALAVPTNPSALAGHPNQIAEPRALQMAWLGNLHYWTVLGLLTQGYKTETPAFIHLAEAHMQGPIASIAMALAARGAGMPFEQLSIGYSPALDDQQAIYFFTRLLREMQAVESDLKGDLPADYPRGVAAASLEELTGLWAATQKLRDFRLRG